MAKILYSTTHGTDDPTRATLPFISASGAIDAGHEPEIVLMGEAVFLMKDSLVEQIHGVGWPPLKEVMGKIFDNKVPIYV